MNRIELGEQQVTNSGLVRTGSVGFHGTYDQPPEVLSKIEQRIYVGKIYNQQFSIYHVRMNHIIYVVGHRILAPARKLERVFRYITVIGQDEI